MRGIFELRFQELVVIKMISEKFILGKEKRKSKNFGVEMSFVCLGDRKKIMDDRKRGREDKQGLDYISFVGVGEKFGFQFN